MFLNAEEKIWIQDIDEVTREVVFRGRCIKNLQIYLKTAGEVGFRGRCIKNLQIYRKTAGDVLIVENLYLAQKQNSIKHVLL